MVGQLVGARVVELNPGELFSQLLEKIDDKIEALAEGFSLWSDKIDALDRRLRAVEEAMADMKVDMTLVKRDVASIKKQLEGKINSVQYRKLEARVTKIEQRVGA